MADQLIACGVSSDRVVVVPNGIAVVRPPVPAPASKDLLVIARHDHGKNLVGLLKALAKARSACLNGAACCNRGPRCCGLGELQLYVVRCPGLRDLN